MIGVVVVTHGQLARELVAAAEMITGEDIPNATSVSIGWHDAPDDAQRAIVSAVERVSGNEGAVILTDMFGGTPSNLALSLLKEGRVEVVTGVNLPMLIRLVSMREEERVGPAEAARAALFQGKENIYLASELLGGGGGAAPVGDESEEGDGAAPDDQAGPGRQD